MTTELRSQHSKPKRLLMKERQLPIRQRSHQLMLLILQLVQKWYPMKLKHCQTKKNMMQLKTRSHSMTPTNSKRQFLTNLKVPKKKLQTSKRPLITLKKKKRKLPRKKLEKLRNKSLSEKERKMLRSRLNLILNRIS